MLNDSNKKFRKTKTHLYFWGSEYSQWFKKDGIIQEDGVKYSSAEQYMMAKKAELFKDLSIKEEILKYSNPNKIKKLGRKISNFNEKIWDDNKIEIVTQGNFLKFSQNKELNDLLIMDKELIIVEASPVDKIWGIGLHFDDNLVLEEKNWNGENLLGICIMKARKKILK